VIATVAGTTSTLSGVTLSSGTTVTVSDLSALALKGTITNGGTLALDSTGDLTQLLIDPGTVKLTGGGALALTDNAQNIITGATPTAVLDNVNNTIAGAGALGNGKLSLTNESGGTVDATGANHLAIDTGAGKLINHGLMEATTGTLDINNSAVTNDGTIESMGTLNITSSTVRNASGTIEANGTAGVYLYGATIMAGTIATSGIGLIETLGNTASLLDGVIVGAGSTVLVADDTTLALQNATTNHGTIALDSLGNATTLQIGPGNVKLTGGGLVKLSDNAGNRIIGPTSDILTNVDNTIRGAGQIGTGDGKLALTNSGTMIADGANALVIDTGRTVTNGGTMEATGGGGLTIDDSVTNTGTIEADGGNVTIGGKLLGTGTAEIFSGNQMELKGASNTPAVVFENNAADNGVLILDNAASFKGTVAGFYSDGTKSDTLDLESLNFNSGVSWSFTENAGNTQGVLTLKDGQNHTAAVTLLGQYLAGGGTVKSSQGSTLFAITADNITGTTGALVTTHVLAPP
jgi:hypothetical protein